MRLKNLFEATSMALALAVLSAPASAWICGSPPGVALIEGLHEAALEPVVVTGIVLEDPARIVEEGPLRPPGPVVDVRPPLPSFSVSTRAVRVLGTQTDASGESPLKLIDLTLDLDCTMGSCGEMPKRFEARVFVLWKNAAGDLVGYSGVCGGSVRPFRDWLEVDAMRRCARGAHFGATASCGRHE